MSQTPQEHEHGFYDDDVEGVDELEPDYDVEETDEAEELVMDENHTDHEDGAQ